MNPNQPHDDSDSDRGPRDDSGTKLGKNSWLSVNLTLTLGGFVGLAIFAFNDFRQEVILGRTEFASELSKTRESFGKDIDELRRDSAVWANDLKHASNELSRIASNIDGQFKMISTQSQELGSLRKDVDFLKDQTKDLKVQVSNLEAQIRKGG